jgi:hypothetical protein
MLTMSSASSSIQRQSLQSTASVRCAKRSCRPASGLLIGSADETQSDVGGFAAVDVSEGQN